MNTPTSQELKKVVSLIRVSTDHQDVARQHTDAARLAKQHGFTIAETVEFLGVSGTAVLNATQTRQVEEILRRPDIAGMCCSSIDRYGRLQKGADFQLITVFEETGKTIYTIRDGVLDMTRPEDWERLMHGLIKGGSELREITRRSVGGKRENAANGFLNSSSVPYGYKYIFRDRSTGIRAHMEIDPTHAPIVVRIFELAMQNFGGNTIAGRLNIEHVPSPRGGRWSRRVLLQILQNHTYAGSFRYPKDDLDGVIVQCPAIVDESVWQSVALNLRNLKERAGRKSSRKWELTGLGWCLYCGHRLTTFPRNRGRGYYRCGHIDRKPPAKHLCPDSRCIDKTALESLVWRSVWTTITDPDTLVRMISSAFEQAPAPDASAIAEIRGRVEKLIRVEARCKENLDDPDLDRAEWKRKMKDAEKARRNAEFELNYAEGNLLRLQRPDDESIQDLAGELAQSEPQTCEEKQTFLRMLGCEFRTDAKQVWIDLQIPQSLLAPTPGGPEANKKGMHNSDRRIGSDPHCASPFSSPLANPISFRINATL